MTTLRNNLVLISIFLLLVCMRPAIAASPEVIGPGCTTAYFIDKDCDGYGVGVKSSGQYVLNASEPVGSAAYYTVGDKPDADDQDPSVSTTAQWQAKWGTNNAGMANFLSTRKGFTNTARIFYVSQSGDDSTGVVNDPAHPYRSLAPILTQLEDLQGGAIIIRGGNWTDLDFRPCSYNHGNPCWNLSGSPGHPVYVMNYPGEAVVTNLPITSVTYKPYPHVCCVTIDGLEFLDPQYGIGDAISTEDTTDFTVKNSEFAGWHQIIFSAHTVNALVQDSVFHDMMYHAIYYAFQTGIAQSGDFNFALDQENWLNGTSEGASYHGQIIGNVMYGNGASGYEPIHINAYMDYPVVEGNIISYSGGTGIGLQTGIYHAFVADNVIFDNGRDCITLNLYAPHGDPSLAATLRWNTIENNTCYVGMGTDLIRGTNPGGGILQEDSTKSHYIKDTTIENNIIVTYDNGASIDPVPLKFQTNSYPETDTIQGNLFWSTGPTTGRVMVINSDASPNGGAGTYSLAQFQAFNANFSGNQYADPQFKSASTAYTLTPGAFNFAVLASSPATNLGANLAALLTPPTPPTLPPTLAVLPNSPSNLRVR